MEKKDNKKLFILVGCLLLVIGVSFSYFVAKTLFNGEGSSVSATTAVINGVTITVDGTLTFNDLDMLPGHQTVSGIKVTATGDKEAIYNLMWKGTNGLNIPLKYTVYKTTEEISDVNAECTKQTKIENGEQHLYETCNITNLDKLGTSISEGEIPSNPFEKTVTLKKDESIMATKEGESVYYYIVLEFPNLEEDQNIDIGKTFEGIVTVEANKLCGTHTVNTILGELEVNDCEPDFSVSSSVLDEGTCTYNGNEVESANYTAVTKNTCQKVYQIDGYNDSNERVTYDFYDNSFTDRYTYVGEGTWDSATSKCMFGENEVYNLNWNEIKSIEDCQAVYSWGEGEYAEYITMIKEVGIGEFEKGAGLCTYDGNTVRSGYVITEETCKKIYIEDYYGETRYYDSRTGEEMLENGEELELAGIGTWEPILTGGAGIYEVEDDYGTSYYYRGAVDNNWVLFAGHYWQVVRVNGDGSLRLIYASNNGGGIDLEEGYSSYAHFNVNDLDNAFVGYMYGKTGGYEEEVKNETTDYFYSYYIYGTSYTFDSISGVYTITGDIKEGNELNNNYAGYYTCQGSDNKTACTEMYYVTEKISNSNYKTSKYTARNLNNSTTYAETHTNTNDSNAKKIIDKWYQDNLASYSNYLDGNAGFCGDRELARGLGYGNYETEYMGYNRYIYSSPSLKCSNKNRDLYTTTGSSNGNKALTYPIGLITADEIIHAGATIEQYNNSFYVYKGEKILSMTPAGFTDFGASIFIDFWGSFSTGFDGGIMRPVINIKASTQILSGDGSKTNPYKITNDEPKVPIGTIAQAG